MARWSCVVLLAAIACQPQPPQTAPTPNAPTASNERPWRPAQAFRGSWSSYAYVDEEELGADLGLAPGDAADSTIERLLTHRFTLPPRVNVAILHLLGTGARGRWFSSGGSADLTQALADSVAAGLSRSSRVGHAALLPALLVGERPTVAGLREAAARLQTQVLLVYRPSCRLFERTPFVGAPQYRAECTIQAALLDTRSGVLPFSALVTRDYVTNRERGDFELGGTWRRVQIQALIKASIEIADRVGDFLTAVPVQSP
jgi:hypothetical protein